MPFLKAAIVTILIVLAAVGSVWAQNQQLFTLTPVVTQNDAAACAATKGRAAVVYTLTENGDLNEGPTFFCLRAAQ